MLSAQSKLSKLSLRNQIGTAVSARKIAEGNGLLLVGIAATKFAAQFLTRFVSSKEFEKESSSGSHGGKSRSSLQHLVHGVEFINWETRLFKLL